MKRVNIWELEGFKEKFKVIFTMENLKELMLNCENRVTVLDEFIPEKSDISGLTVFSGLERSAIKQNIAMNYTSVGCPVVYSEGDFGVTVINSKFFKKNKKELLDVFYQSLSEIDKKFIFIDSYFFDNDRVKRLLSEKPDITLSLNVNPSEISFENVKYMQDNFIECRANFEEVSSKYVIGYYTKQALLHMDDIKLSKEDLDERGIENLKYLKPGTKVRIADSRDNQTNLDLYSKIINRAEKGGISCTVEIDENCVGDKLRQIDFGTLDLKNTSIILNRDLHNYTLDEYIKEDEYLESLVQHIKASDMSPFERYLAVYNIVKQFKPYKENEVDKNQARYLRHIIDNDYIVCVGFSKLLEDLSRRVGIEAKGISVGVDISYKDGFTLEGIPTEYAGHQRTLVNIKDPKYGIDGYYIADATWDNFMDKDVYVHAAMTFRETTQENLMQYLTDKDYLFDVQNMKEFNSKVNALIDKKIRYRKEHLPLSIFSYKEENEYQRQQRLESGYEKQEIRGIFSSVENLFRDLDYEVYMDFHKKYAYLNDDSAKEEYYDFLTDLGRHMIAHTNKPISKQTLLAAAANVKIYTEDLTLDSLEEVMVSLAEVQGIFQEKYFPKMEVQSSDGVSYLNDENEFESVQFKTK